MRALEEADLDECEALCKKVHGFERTNELRDAIQAFKPFVAVRDGRITAYASSVAFWPMNHGVAESEEDMQALLLGAAAAVDEPIAFLVPLRSELVPLVLGSGPSPGEADEPDGARRVPGAARAPGSRACSTEAERRELLKKRIARRLGIFSAAALLSLSLAGSASRRRPADRGRRSLDRHRAGRRGGRERGRGRLPHLRREDERHPRLLGRTTPRPGHPARGHLHRGERRRRPHCGVRTNGTVACWGDNGYGQATPPPGTFTAVSAGGAPHLRREDERHPRLLGRQRLRPGHPARGHLHRGQRRRRHTCGMRTNGTVACWGDNAIGQATPPAGTFTAVSAGGDHTCGVRTNGTLACWGDNGERPGHPARGHLHRGQRRRPPHLRGEDERHPRLLGRQRFGQATPPAGTFTAVSAGVDHTCGVKDERRRRLLGRQRLRPGHPAPGHLRRRRGRAPEVTPPAASGRNGTLACWGSNGFGQANPPAGTFTAVSAGGSHTCGVRTNGTLACWGRNGSGQATPPAGTFTAVSAGDFHTCGIRTNGTARLLGHERSARPPRPRAPSPRSAPAASTPAG